MRLLVSLYTVSSFLFLAVTAYPGGKIIKSPPLQSDTGIKPIPDKRHPYKAPGPNDLRGPCPGLNTLANHGYLPRSGIATFEEIVTAVGEGFNMDHDLASGIAAFAMLARGNAYTNQISIGGPTDKIPALPGNIDGNVTKGLATHGRFEGDVSMTRRDAAIGDNVHLDPQLFQQLLDNVALYGNDSDVTGPKSVVSYKAMQEFKYERYLDSLANDPVLEYHFGRFVLSYGEASFTLNFFANGTDGVLSTDTLKSIFQNQTFPANWHRRGNPGTIQLIGDGVDMVLSAHPEAVPGVKINGTFVPDPTGDPCGLYKDIGVNTVPAVLVNTTGVLKKNVDFLLQSIHNLFPNCTFTLPIGAAGI
ncbi:heme-thiolate peroxidase [Flagelloscypha sp. PMI_526]|nr:heme-thiolate peroxidase [Flagelloscypha sp. PMI_526]